MSKIYLYLTKNKEKEIRKAAKQAKLSLRQWLLRAAEKELKASQWQELLPLAGTWAEDDFPEGEELKKLIGEDISDFPRENF